MGNGNCGGLQAPCGRICYPSDPATTASCGYVPDSCQGDLSWAATTGTKSYSYWYPDFESITGVSLSAAGTEDVQLYWYCQSWNPNGNCDGLEAPCGRSCGGSAAFTGESSGETDAISNLAGNLLWILIGLAVAIGVLFCGVMAVCVWRKNKKLEESVGDDGVTLKDDQQLQRQTVDDQMIELEESVEMQPDGDVPTV